MDLRPQKYSDREEGDALVTSRQAGRVAEQRTLRLSITARIAA